MDFNQAMEAGKEVTFKLTPAGEIAMCIDGIVYAVGNSFTLYKKKPTSRALLNTRKKSRAARIERDIKLLEARVTAQDEQIRQLGQQLEYKANVPMMYGGK